MGGALDRIGSQLSRVVFPDKDNRLWFQPFTSIYLHSADIRNDFIRKGKIENVHLFLTLAFFVLFLATVNYALLTTARAAMRFKEIGVRKIFGCSSGHLKIQLITESLLLTIIAFPLSFIFLGLIIPGIESIFPGQFFFYSSYLVKYLMITLGVTILAGLLSGSYVSYYLSGLEPITALKSNYFFLKKVNVKKNFVVVQLFITTALFIALILVSRQIRFLLEPESGIDNSNLITLKTDFEDHADYIQLKQSLLKSSYLQSITGSSVSIPSNAIQENIVSIPNSNQKKIKLETVLIDTCFFQTLKVPVLKSFRTSRHQFDSATGTAYLNEEAFNSLKFTHDDQPVIGPYAIAGVVPDFSIHTLHKKINPTLFIVAPEACRTLIIRYKQGYNKEFLNDLRSSFYTIRPSSTLNYQYFNERMKTLYVREQNFERIIATFTIAAFFITGMGLFGMAMLITEQRMREMSIRKVFGAQAKAIVFLIQRDFIISTLISSALAIPVAWFLMTLWLKSFHYHIAIQWHLVILACIAVGAFVSSIIFFKTLRILRESPSTALKYE